MAVVPAVPTFGSGILTASLLNQLADCVVFGLNRPRAELRQTVAQSIAVSGTFQAVTFDAEDVDANIGGLSQHDNVTNNSRFTAQYAGSYLCLGGTSYAANITNRRGNRWAVNGAATNATEVILPTTGTGTCQPPSRGKLIFLNVGDYVELQAWQDSGGALNTSVAAASQQCHATIIWMGS